MAASQVPRSPTRLPAAGERLPNLRELKLSGSHISSLRELGTALSSVEVLWVSRCGLHDLQGLTAFGSLKELFASFNDINDLSGAAGSEALEVLDLDSNSVADVAQLDYLGECDALTSITFEGNPVASVAGFRTALARALPRLEYLDDMPFSADEDGDAAGLGDTLGSEMNLVMEGIRHARLGIDDTMYDAETQQEALPAFDVHDPYRPRTAAPAGGSEGAAAPGYRPATAGAGVAALIG